MRTLSTSTDLEQTRSSFEEALHYFRSGNFSEAIKATHGRFDFASKMLESRSLIRVGQPELVDSLISDALTSSDSAIAAEASALAATALVASGHYWKAASVLMEARGKAVGQPNIALEAEVIFIQAARDWSLYEFGSCMERIAEINALTEPIRVESFACEASYIYDFKFWQARACELSGFCAEAKGNLGRQASLTLKAVNLLERSGTPDAYIESRMLLIAAILIRDMNAESLYRALTDRASRLVWTDDTRAVETLVFQGIGVRSLEQGDYSRAALSLKRAISAAPSNFLRLDSTIYHQAFLQCVGLQLDSVAQLSAIRTLADEIDWITVDPRSRSVLLSVADVLAVSDNAAARGFLERYRRLDSVFTPINRPSGPQKNVALEHFVEGRILRHAGDLRKARPLLQRAYDAWAALGTDRLWALVSFEIADAYDDPKYRKIVREYATAHPRSPVAERYRARFGDLATVGISNLVEFRPRTTRPKADASYPSLPVTPLRR